jgi:WD40 repeat protein
VATALAELVEVRRVGTLFRQTLQKNHEVVPLPSPLTMIAAATQTLLGEHVSAITSAPDGRRLAIGTTKGKVEIWDRGGRVQASLRLHGGIVRAAAWARDGKRLATVGADCTLRIWDPVIGTVQVRQETTGQIRTVDWSNDDRVVTGDDDGRLIIRRPDGAVLHELTDHGGSISSVTWATNSPYIASTSDNGIAVWHADSARLMLRLSVPKCIQRSASWAPDGRRLASVGDDNVIHLWRISEEVMQVDRTNELPHGRRSS